MWLASPPIKFTAPLLLLCLVPLLIDFERIIQSDNRKKGKRVFLSARSTLLIWNTTSIYWVYIAISAVNGAIVSFFVSLIPFGLGALLMTFAFWLYYILSRLVNKYIAYLGLICFYIAMEFLHESWDLAFPWMNLGN